MVIRKFLSAASIVFAVALLTSTTNATNSWGNYHWERSTDQLLLELGDNMSGQWDAHLEVASADWSVSTVLETPVGDGGTSPRRCRPTRGRVEVCNSRYGNNGWLGLAQIWVSGGHITQGVVKNNDFYFDMPAYDSPEWRLFVICQEVGHTFGLGHQDVNFNNTNLDSCMDYTSDPGSNQHPNTHDYEQLASIYVHLDAVPVSDDDGGGNCNPKSKKCKGGFSGPPAMNQLDLNGPGQWGRLIGASASGRTSVYELDFGNGNKIITHVIWALESD